MKNADLIAGGMVGVHEMEAASKSVFVSKASRYRLGIGWLTILQSQIRQPREPLHIEWPRDLNPED